MLPAEHMKKTTSLLRNELSEDHGTTGGKKRGERNGGEGEAVPGEKSPPPLRGEGG